MARPGVRETSSRAFLIRSVDVRDADRIVTLLTESDGRTSMVCRGARRSRRRFAGALEPLSLLRVRWRIRTTTMHALQDAVIEHSFPRVLKDLERIAFATYGLELAGALCSEGEGDEDIFAAAVGFMNSMDEERVNVASTAMVFALRVLGFGGFAPNVDVCAVTGAVAPDSAAAFFDPRLGSIVSKRAGGAKHLLSRNMRDFVRGALENLPLGELPSLSKKEQRELFDAADELAQAQLGHSLRAARLVTQLADFT